MRQVCRASGSEPSSRDQRPPSSRRNACRDPARDGIDCCFSLPCSGFLDQAPSGVDRAALQASARDRVRRVHVLPGLSVFGIILIVLLLTIVLNYGLFKPITRVLDERTRVIKSAGEAAQAAAAKAEAAAAEFERRTRTAQAEVYKAMDD